MRAAVKKNGVQKQKTRWGTALAAAAAAAAERLGARKKSFFFWNFFSHLGHHADLIHGLWVCLTFGLPAAPRAISNFARITKMAISRKGGVLRKGAFYLPRPQVGTFAAPPAKALPVTHPRCRVSPAAGLGGSPPDPPEILPLGTNLRFRCPGC